jgi:hypothetical protein
MVSLSHSRKIRIIRQMKTTQGEEHSKKEYTHEHWENHILNS